MPRRPMAAFAILIALAAPIAAPAGAADYHHLQAGLAISVPDTWPVRRDGDLLHVRAPTGDAVIYLESAPAGGADALVLDVVDQLQAEFDSLWMPDEGQLRRQNGLTIRAFDGVGALGGRRVGISMWVIATPTGETANFLAYLAEPARARWAATLGAIGASLRPLE